METISITTPITEVEIKAKIGMTIKLMIISERVISLLTMLD
jgi:hypothetical protein